MWLFFNEYHENLTQAGSAGGSRSDIADWGTKQ